MVLDLSNDRGDQTSVSGNPLKFRNEQELTHRYPPALGGDTREILSDLLELSEDDFDAYLAKGVVHQK